MANPVMIAQEKATKPQLLNATRRDVRLIAQGCLDEGTLQAFLVDAEIPQGSLCGASLHERILSLLHRVEADGRFEFFVEWLERERRPCVEHRMAMLHAEAPATDETKWETQPTSPAAVRQMLYNLLPTSADFDAFLIDCFPTEVQRRFADTADREAKHNLLLQLVELSEIVAALRRRALKTLAHRVRLL